MAECDLHQEVHTRANFFSTGSRESVEAEAHKWDYEVALATSCGDDVNCERTPRVARLEILQLYGEIREGKRDKRSDK